MAVLDGLLLVLREQRQLVAITARQCGKLALLTKHLFYVALLHRLASRKIERVKGPRRVRSSCFFAPDCVPMLMVCDGE